MINKPPPFKGPNMLIPIIIPMKGREFINQGSTLGVPLQTMKRQGFRTLLSLYSLTWTLDVLQYLLLLDRKTSRVQIHSGEYTEQVASWQNRAEGERS